MNLGDVVRTPEGKLGTIATLQNPPGGSHRLYEAGSALNIPVCAVILESGKVEHWTGASLAAAAS